MNSLFIDITRLFLICNEHSFKRLYWFFVLCLVIGISDVTVLAVVFFSYQVIFRKEDFGADILANLVPKIFWSGDCFCHILILFANPIF